MPAPRRRVTSFHDDLEYLDVGGDDPDRSASAPAEAIEEGHGESVYNGRGMGVVYGSRTIRPFAWLPMVAISLTLIAHNATLSSLYTYVGVFVQDLIGLPSADSAGYYAGFLTSAFTVGRLTTSYAWGYFADRFGRKPVFIISMIAIAVSSIGFGLSTTFAMAVMWRFAFGMSIGVWSIARIMIPEILGPNHVVIGMACMPASRAIGGIIGPACGGLLGRPAETFPGLFSETGLFGRHPFLLTNVALAFLALASLPFVIFHLPETMITPDVNSERFVENKSSKHTTMANGDSIVGCSTSTSNTINRSSASSSSSFPIDASGAGSGAVSLTSLTTHRASSSSIAPSHTSIPTMDGGMKELRLSSGQDSNREDSEIRQQKHQHSGRSSAPTIDDNSMNSARTAATCNNSISSNASFLGNDRHGNDHDVGNAEDEYDDDDDDDDDDDGSGLAKGRRRSSFFSFKEPPLLAAGGCTCCSRNDGGSGRSNHNDGDKGNSSRWALCRCSSLSFSSSRGGWNSVSTEGGDGGGGGGGGGDTWYGPDGLLAPWPVRSVLIMEGLIAFLTIGLTECFPLWALMTKAIGGLFWNISKIGRMLLWTGVAMMLYQFVGYPYLCRKIGIVKLLRVTAVTTCVLIAAMPDTLRQNWSEGTSYFLTIVLLTMIDAGLSVWNIGLALAAANAVPANKRGQFMGMFTVAETLGRAIGPAAFGSMLAWSVEHNSMADYHLVFMIQSILMFVVVAIGWRTLTLERMTLPTEDRHNDLDIAAQADSPRSSLPACALVVLPH